MRIHARAIAAASALGVLATLAGPGAQAPESYKLGMFRQNTRTLVGVVVGETMVLDLSRAGISAPATLKELIARWDTAMANRIARLAADARRTPPAFATELAQLTTLPPIEDPGVILNAAVNYQEHAAEMRSGATAAADAASVAPNVARGIPGIWERAPGDTRQNPYFFLKAKSAITAHGQPIVLPPGRTQIDWECELNVVIGRTASRVKAAQAADYIFGYTLQNDVSDRGGRPDARHGSDWLVGKSHDTFAPLGPFVVPRAFVPNPQKLAVTFTLNDRVMQDSNTDRMTHTVFELVEYASHILTLRPGDLISTGSPAGVGTARATPIYFKDGDVSTCTIERIGTLRNPVRAAPPG
jgi:2-keto-4-pentenoate hydratase/2-oxohepta-3-ene-1,7-dioic acid hydratase in catechol pathway